MTRNRPGLIVNGRRDLFNVMEIFHNWIAADGCAVNLPNIIVHKTGEFCGL